LLGTLVTAGAAGCGDGEPESTKYVQTWTKDYGDTTCAEFVDEMTTQQRFVMAGDMLVRVWRAEDPDARIPTDEEMTSFAVAVGLVCADEELADVLKATEIAAALYTLSDGFRP